VLVLVLVQCGSMGMLVLLHVVDGLGLRLRVCVVLRLQLRLRLEALQLLLERVRGHRHHATTRRTALPGSLPGGLSGGLLARGRGEGDAAAAQEAV
jgi:hypothetical protein